MNIYITADWHLAKGAWKPRPEISGDAFASLESLVSNLDLDDDREQIVDYIIAAGDLFDTKTPSSFAVNRACELLRTDGMNPEYTQRYIGYIQGQHELSDPPWLRVADADHLDYGQRMSAPTCGVPYVKLFPDTYIWGMDWTLSLHLQERLDEIGLLFAKQKKISPGYHILVLHQTCNAVMAGMGDDRDHILDSLDYRACELKDGMLPHGFDLVVVGDTHYHTEFTLLDKKGAAVRCLSPGSFAMQSISEINIGQCFVLDSVTKEITSMELYRRPYEEIKIDSPVDWDIEIRGRIRQPEAESQLLMPIIKYTLYENDSDRISALKIACQNKIHPFFYVVKSDTEATPTEITKSENVDELILRAIQDAEATDKAKELLRDLIGSNSADETLNAYYKEIVLNATETTN